VWAIAAGFAGCAVVCVGISQVGSYHVYAGLAMVLGLGNAVGNGALGPLFLLRTGEDHRGRVIATLSGFFSSASIFALFLGGFVGAWLPPRMVFLAGGLLALPVVAVMTILAVPSARSVASAPDG
jgi:MFS family permease